MRPQFPLRVRLAAGAFAAATLSAAGVSSAAVIPTSTTTAPAPVVAPAAAKAPVTIRPTARRLHVRAGRAAFVRGVVSATAAPRTVALQVRRGGRWRAVDRDRTDGRGRFALRHRPARTGGWAVRVRDAGGATRAVGRLRVYRPAVASWYGPGLYGNGLGCGGRLSPATVGVAHKTLPCGTRVVLRYRGRTVRVPVVDRGPFVGGREFDLTAATRARLGFGSTGVVWTTA